MKINLDPEVEDILLSDNYIIKEGKSKYFINFRKLTYKNNRKDTTSVEIIPEMTLIEKEFGKFDKDLTFKNNWNNIFNEKVLPFLNSEQISAYHNWLARQDKTNLRGCCKGYKKY